MILVSDQPQYPGSPAFPEHLPSAFQLTLTVLELIVYKVGTLPTRPFLFPCSWHARAIVWSTGIAMLRYRFPPACAAVAIGATKTDRIDHDKATLLS
jgi:hypothetical protein